MHRASEPTLKRGWQFADKILTGARRPRFRQAACFCDTSSSGAAFFRQHEAGQSRKALETRKNAATNPGEGLALFTEPARWYLSAAFAGRRHVVNLAALAEGAGFCHHHRLPALAIWPACIENL